MLKAFKNQDVNLHEIWNAGNGGFRLRHKLGGVLSQLASGDSGRWYPVTRLRLDTLAIVEAFKNWRHYLKGYKQEVFMLPDHNEFRRFMDT